MDDWGNCLEACFASVLEVPLDVVPHRPSGAPDPMVDDWWFNTFVPWLEQFGVGFVCRAWRRPTPVSKIDFVSSGYWIAGVFVEVDRPGPETMSRLLEGKLPEHGNHAVVMRGREVAWDPSPIPWDDLLLDHRGEARVTTAYDFTILDPAEPTRTRTAPPTGRAS